MTTRQRLVYVNHPMKGRFDVYKAMGKPKPLFGVRAWREIKFQIGELQERLVEKFNDWQRKRLDTPDIERERLLMREEPTGWERTRRVLNKVCLPLGWYHDDEIPYTYTNCGLFFKSDDDRESFASKFASLLGIDIRNVSFEPIEKEQGEFYKYKVEADFCLIRRA